ncbi:ferric iron uptake transcriptional regulator [Turicimonas muris]|uniref:ferric iron uptake transcriptional regulator n=1 Tax=Turicimonas muris TaxID=1796652 RepID=UPI0025723E3F|nr:ferric iron uptake transcriptional regulator [Turicimonas muris]
MIKKTFNPANPFDLKDLGLKATGPRLKILDLFIKNADSGKKRHMSAEEVYRTLVQEGEGVGLATVYRVLAQFEAAGILVRRTFDKDNALFELNDNHHHDHLICVSCGKVEEFVDPEIEEKQKEISKKHGFGLVHHSMALYGLCADCQKKEAK